MQFNDFQSVRVHTYRILDILLLLLTATLRVESEIDEINEIFHISDVADELKS